VSGLTSYVVLGGPSIDVPLFVNSDAGATVVDASGAADGSAVMEELPDVMMRPLVVVVVVVL
jgi:hypothetical protein